MKFYCILLLVALLTCIYALEAEITEVVKMKKKSFTCLFKIHYEGDTCFGNSSVSCSPNGGRKVAKNVDLALVDGTIISIKQLKINRKKDRIIGCKATSPTSQLDTDQNTKCLTSPDYPNNYPDNSNIKLGLSVPDGQEMEITFQDFDVEDCNVGLGSKCPYDYLEFSDGNGKIIGKQLYGETLPQKLTISTSTASAYFHSDGFITRKGFKFCYKPSISPVTNEACKCGLAKRNTRIVGGHETGINEYPWLVALVQLGHKDPWIWCGGTLINSRWVLTAAHCLDDIYNLTSVRVLLGEHNWKITGESIMVNRSVIEKINHPNYNKPDYDISLLKIDPPINFSQYSHIRPGCLPKNENKGPEPDSGLVGTIATVAGWGKITEFGPVSDYAREVDVKIYTSNQCKSAIRSTFTKRMICAGFPEGGKDSCYFDSGGPLMYTSGNGESPGENYEVTGVVNWGVGCARPGNPGVYANVSSVLPWIMKIADNGTWCPRT